MRFLGWLAIAGALCVVACGKSTASNVATTTQAVPPVSDSTPVDTTPSTPKDSTPDASKAPDDPSKAATEAVKASVKDQKPAKIPEKGTDGWHKSSLSAAALGTSMDKAFYHLHGGHADFRVDYFLPVGKGFAIGVDQFKDDNLFSVQYPIIQGEKPRPEVMEVRANGGFAAQLHPGQGKDKEAWSAKRRYAPGGALKGAEVVARWPMDMPELSMSHFITGKDVYGPLFSTLAAPGSGYVVSTEERETKILSGRVIKDYRIIATKQPTAANRNESATIELVIDGRKLVPVTMRTHVKPSGKKESVIEWHAEWRAGKFDMKNFVLPG